MNYITVRLTEYQYATLLKRTQYLIDDSRNLLSDGAGMVWRQKHYPEDVEKIRNRLSFNTRLLETLKKSLGQ